ncbi:MAG: hypothetical protein WKF89_16125 [Chitinophagaceae bacterium]
MLFNKRVNRFPRMIFFPLLFVVITLVLGVAVMYLWNTILTDVVEVKRLGYWQAVGLLILCRVLFGNFGRTRRGARHPMASSYSPWRNKLMQMSAEERARFREEWRKRCAPKKDG